MKSLKTFAIAAASLAAAGFAHAQTIIHIVGSNGDRSASQTAIGHILDAGGSWTFQGLKGVSSSSTSNTNAVASNYGVWNGTYNSTAVVIKVSYIGAAGAVAAVSGSLTAPFVQPNLAGTSGTLPDPTISGNPNELSVPDFGFSTNFQATTRFNGDYLGHTYGPLDETNVGISALLFVASPGFPAGSNFTSQLAQQLYSTGSIPLALFTASGLSADETTLVYALGRNTDAGQRFGAYAEFGLGVNANVKDWLPNNSAGSSLTLVNPTGQVAANGTTGAPKYGGTVDGLRLWPRETVSGVDSGSAGNSGFTTGSDLAPYLTTVLGTAAYQKANSSATGGYFIGYVTPSDYNASIANTLIPSVNRGVLLKWNGVDYTQSNLKNGSYTAWVYNRIIKRQGDLVPGSSLTANFFAALTNQILTVDAAAGGGIVLDANPKVVRYTDGGLVYPNY